MSGFYFILYIAGVWGIAVVLGRIVLYTCIKLVRTEQGYHWGIATLILILSGSLSHKDMERVQCAVIGGGVSL